MGAPTRSPSLVFELVVLSVWLGAAVLFTAVVAPALFHALPSRTMAGDVVGRVLPAVLYAGAAMSFVVGLIEAVAQNAILTSRWPAGAQRPDLNDVVHFGGYGAAGQRAGAGFLIGGACVWALVIGQRIDALRVSIGVPIDALPASDPRRADFGRLHAFSVALLGVAMLATAGLIVSTARRLHAQRPARHTVQRQLEPSHHV
jgi:hypothetical protein